MKGDTMSTETASVFGESLSAAEQAYFSSKGTEAAGLESEAQPETVTQADPVQPVEQQAEPQAQADDDQDGIYIDENGKARSVVTGKFVPHGAFHKERERRKGVEAENITLREQMARADERLTVLNQIIAAGETPQQTQTRQQQEAAPPDPETDIFGYVKWQADQIQKLTEQTQSFHQKQEQYRQSQELQTFYRNDALAYMQKVPDFKDAYQYVAQSYVNELAARGMNEDQIKSQLMAEEAGIVWQAKQRGVSPSQVIYDMAKARGYRASSLTQPAPTTHEHTHTQTTPNAAEKLKTIAKAQAAMPNVSSSGGSEGLTLEALANMSDDEFAAVERKLGKAKFRALLGG